MLGWLILKFHIHSKLCITVIIKYLIRDNTNNSVIYL